MRSTHGKTIPELKQLPRFDGTLHIGVTGHRDLRVQDEEETRLYLEQFFDSLAARLSLSAYPQPLEEIVLHTALAPGADQLVAEVLSKWASEQSLTARIQPVFPGAAQKYQDDQRREYEDYELLKLLCSLSGSMRRTGPFRADRDESYPMAAIEHDLRHGEPLQKNETVDYTTICQHFIKHCDLVLALWDGTHNGYPGGTSDVVDTILRKIGEEERGNSPAFADRVRGYFSGSHLEERRVRCQALYWLAVPRTINPYPTVGRHRWASVPSEVLSSDAFSSPGWRERVRTASGVVIVVSFVTAIICGYIGYAEFCEKSDGIANTFQNKFFGSVGHIFGDFFPWGNDLRITAPWKDTGRFAAFIFLVLSAWKILNHTFHLVDKWRRFKIALQPHDLIFGVGDRGHHLLYDLKLAKHPTIVVEKSSSPELERICERANVPLIVGDASAVEFLPKLGLERCQHAFVCTGNDLTNTKILHRLACYERNRKLEQSLICSVGLEKTTNFESLRTAVPKGINLDLRIFNREDVTARSLLRHVPLDRFADRPEGVGATVVIIGNGPMVDAILRLVIGQAHFESCRPVEIKRFCRDSKLERDAFIARSPCYTAQGSHALPVDAVWEREDVLRPIEFFQLPDSCRERMEVIEHHLTDRSTVYTLLVADPDPLKSADIAKDIAPSLDRLRRNHAIDLVMWFHFNVLQDRLRIDLERKLDESFNHVQIRAFGDFLGPCNKACALGESNDLIARRLNGFYAHQYSEHASESLTTTLIDHYWQKCPERNRESSRQAAEHAFVKYRVRQRLLGDSESDWEEEIALFPRKASDRKKNASAERQRIWDTAQALAKIEHNRWCAEHLMNGFRPLTAIPPENVAVGDPSPEDAESIDRWFHRGEKGAFRQQRMHVDLVPFKSLVSLLGEERGWSEQIKDIDQIQVLDKLLFGFSGEKNPPMSRHGQE